MILDIDTGVDDALALAMAVRHPEISLEAVLTVAGNVGLELTTRNTLRVQDWLGATDIPVAAGADRPLSGVVVDAGHWHGSDELGGGTLPDSARSALDDGVGYLIDRVTAEPGEFTLVCVGPDGGQLCSARLWASASRPSSYGTCDRAEHQTVRLRRNL
jgi:inosine-uridine nucleoside N-ribohydrolase